MGGTKDGDERGAGRHSIRSRLIAYGFALLACFGAIRVASAAQAEGPTSDFAPLTSGWTGGRAPGDAIAEARGEVGEYLTGGSLAADGEFPWMTFVLTQDFSGAFFRCGGTLIAPTYVLTAAHCLETANRAAVIVGRNAAPTTLTDPAFVFADGKALHPDYVTDGAQGDIAILRLETPVTTPVTPLAHPEDATQSAAGVLATITGWGRTAPGSPPADLLQKGSMPIRSAPECTGANPAYSDASNVCAGYLTGEGFAATGGCEGDSGGPLLVSTTDSRTRIQVGTVSYGPVSGCVELDKPIVYMRVSYYLSWIESITGDLVGPPPTTTTTTTTTTSTTTTTPQSTTTTVPASTTTTTTTSTTTTTVAVAPVTTVSNAASFAASSSGSSGGSGGSSALAATGSPGWLTTEFVAWALVVLILGRMTLLVARRPAVR